MNEIENMMTEAGVKPTSNRILVLRRLSASDTPLSLADLETSIETLEKSSISRVLNLFVEHSLVHTVEDGRGIVKYEICRGHESHGAEDMHIHFYCEMCRRVYCFEDIPVPSVTLPSGFDIRSVNYMLKGVCPACCGEM